MDTASINPLAQYFVSINAHSVGGLSVLKHYSRPHEIFSTSIGPSCPRNIRYQTIAEAFHSPPCSYAVPIAQTMQKKSLKTVPSLAMSFFNDCFYIALHLLTLGLQYQDRYASSLAALIFN